METNDNGTRIERYLTEQMTPEENEAFLNDLRNDKELREEAQMMAMAIKEVKEKQAMQDAEIIEEVLASNGTAFTPAVAASTAVGVTGGKTIRLVRWAASIAAMFVLIFGATHIYRMNKIDNLFNDYYTSYDVSSARGGDDEAIKEELAILYNKVGTDKDVTSVIDRLQTIYDNIQSNSDEYVDYSYYENDIAWYLALAYIKNNNLDKAKELLKPLADNGNAEADKLLKEL